MIKETNYLSLSVLCPLNSWGNYRKCRNVILITGHYALPWATRSCFSARMTSGFWGPCVSSLHPHSALNSDRAHSKQKWLGISDGLLSASSSQLFVVLKLPPFPPPVLMIEWVAKKMINARKKAKVGNLQNTV